MSRHFLSTQHPLALSSCCCSEQNLNRILYFVGWAEVNKGAIKKWPRGCTLASTHAGHYTQTPRSQHPAGPILCESSAESQPTKEGHVTCDCVCTGHASYTTLIAETAQYVPPTVALLECLGSRSGSLYTCILSTGFQGVSLLKLYE